jgi:cell wall-associated NlpC family hydrolase
MVQHSLCILCIRMRILITTLVVITISGCAANAPLVSLPREPSSERAPRIPKPAPQSGGTIAERALAMVGAPYLYGGSTPDTGFDCSGLVFYSYSQSGVTVPRTSREQFRRARKISLSEAGEGDLLFFQDQEKLSHVGIYIGAGSFVHAPASGRTVSIASLDNEYYQMHLVGVGRLLP